MYILHQISPPPPFGAHSFFPFTEMRWRVQKDGRAKKNTIMTLVFPPALRIPAMFILNRVASVSFFVVSKSLTVFRYREYMESATATIKPWKKEEEKILWHCSIVLREWWPRYPGTGCWWTCGVTCAALRPAPSSPLSPSSIRRSSSSLDRYCRLFYE